MRYFFVIVLASALFAACSRPVNPVNTDAGGLAIKGYDPVAYFTDQRPVNGSAEFEFIWMDAKWRFASSEHREMFSRNPEQYAPAYGGYCAYAVSQGKTADIDPEAWSIVRGRLYLNLNKDVQRLWNSDRENYIKKADVNWPKLRTGR